jgi:histidinol-phosphate/aromatic aminotransferase/cobyric acid decarboxylase-like protein
MPHPHPTPSSGAPLSPPSSSVSPAGAARGGGDAIALGPQGGDPRHRRRPLVVDLSTCVSPHGPPPAAVDALRALSAEVLARHPYGAADALRLAYAGYLGVAPAELVVARGASEFVWQLAASASASQVDVPLPAYTEYCQAFPEAAAVGPVDAGRSVPAARSGPSRSIGPSGDGMHHSLAAIDAAMAAGRIVLLSNPHNPSGRAFAAAELADVAKARPQGTLVVDESYVEFCADPAHWSLIGVDAGNVAVVRSPSKFFGLAGARVGVTWSRSPTSRSRLTPQRGSWPVSTLEVEPVVAALADGAWAAHNRATTLGDTVWLAALLDRVGPLLGIVVVEGAVTHYRLAGTPRAAALADALAAAGVGVRVLGAAHGLPSPAVRVTAPAEADRAVVARAFDAVAAAWAIDGGPEPAPRPLPALASAATATTATATARPGRPAGPSGLPDAAPAARAAAADQPPIVSR